MLRSVSKQNLITYIGPNESMVSLEAVYIVKGEEAAAKYSQARGGPNTVDRFSLLVGSTRSRNTLTAMIADNCFVHSYFHQSFRYLSVSDVVVGVHTQNYIIAFVA